MDALFGVDWQSMLVPTTAILELILRASLMYLAVFLMFRFVLMRQAGAVGMADLLVVVFVADAAQNALSADYRSVPEGLIVVGTIVFWAYAMDWLSYHVAWIQRIVSPPPLPLVENGRLMRRNMRYELISEDELMSQLRLQGVEEVSEVRSACMESDGRISVVKRDRAADNGHNDRRGAK